ncbi:MAG: hypothetical protein HRU13_12445 [Phycisphaerales bacterium]|nr:hypothetical protein [Phycisphaerales bacterium]
MADKPNDQSPEPVGDEYYEDSMEIPPSTAEEVSEALNALKTVLDSKGVHKFRSIVEAKHTRQVELDAQATERHQKVLAAQVQVANKWPWVFLGCVLLSFAFLLGVIWMLKDNSEALLPVVTALVGLIAGTGGGWVFGHRASKIHE